MFLLNFMHMKASSKNLKRFLKKKPIRVNPNIGDHANDPFFVKKLEKAKQRLQNVVIPPELYSKL